jgi:hypothetical protein
VKIDKQLAWNTTEVLLMSIGGISLTAFVLQCHYYLVVILCVTLPGVWAVLYKFLENLRSKWVSVRPGAAEKAGVLPTDNSTIPREVLGIRREPPMVRTPANSF